MENVVPGQTVNLAAGEYSIAEFNNQYDIWGAGMTALCFKTTDVTLKGAGPDKTVITVPAGYVGIRMERNGASVQDLTVKAYRPENMPYHYNWHMQGAICACNCEGMSIKNVAIYSEQKTGEIRPFSAYSVTGLTVERLGVEAPYCASPVFFDKVTNVDVSYLTVSGCNEDQNPAVYCGNWPWGVNEGLTFRNVLLCNTFYPFTVEIDEEVFIYDSVYYNCAEESNFNEDADVVEENCTYYAEGENSPELAEVDGYILTAVNPFYKNIGWHTYIEEFAAATLGYNLRGTGSIAVDGNEGFEEVWKSEYFKDMYICGSAVEYEGYLYLSNDPSPDATVLKINVETGEVEEFYTEPSWDNGAPTITDAGYLYVCDEKANLCKVDIETGETVWICQLADSGDRLTSSAIKFNGGKAYVKVAGKGLFAVTANGSVAWCYEDADCADGWAGNGVSFNADGTQVYYKDAGAVIAVNTADGTLAWTGDTDEADTDDNMSCREPIVGADGTVFAIARPGDDNAVIYAFNSDGSKKWATTLSARCGDDGGLALNLGEDIVFASYQEGVAALSTETGEIIWEAPIGHVRNSVVPINEGGLYAVTEGDDGSFLVFLTDGTDGVEPTVVWSYEIADTNTSNHMRPVVLENGDVFCGTPYTIACVRPVVPEPAIFGLLALVALFLRRK
jgi:outer membrane protein assembly factor BamB